MGIFQAKTAELIKLTALALLVLSCFTGTVLGDVVDSWTQPPHHAPMYPPVGAPHHHKGGGHHHKVPTHPPVHPPIHPPVKAPSHPPVKTPSHPPVKAPTPSPVKAPSHPPVKAPTPSPVKAPRHPPVKTPSHPPVKAPTPSPVKAPSHPPVHPPTSYPVPTRKLVAVQGVVYCKPCKYFGIDTLLGATPLLGATVRLECKNTKYKAIVREAKTDKNGYFFIMAPKTITTYASHKCKVYLVSSPKSSKCKKPTNLHYGLKGAILMPTKPTLPPPPPSLQVFTVGPFAFEPSTKLPCPH